MEKKVIKMSEILTDLDNGLTRLEIKAKYELTGREMASLFSHPSLKSRKPKKKLELSFIFEEDVDVAVEEKVEEKVEEAPSSIAREELIEKNDESMVYPMTFEESTDVDPFDI
jgi:hypothetical protein